MQKHLKSTVEYFFDDQQAFSGEPFDLKVVTTQIDGTVETHTRHGIKLEETITVILKVIVH